MHVTEKQDAFGSETSGFFIKIIWNKYFTILFWKAMQHVIYADSQQRGKEKKTILHFEKLIELSWFTTNLLSLFFQSK